MTMSKSVDVEVANIKEAMTGLNNEKVITPYSLNQVIKRKAGGADGSPGPGIAAGGSINNLLVKSSAVDYDTAWMTLQTLFS